MADRIYIVVVRDRHSDASVTVHRTRAGADAKIAETKAEYDRHYLHEPLKWKEQSYGNRGDVTGSWVRYVDCHDDGPKMYIEIGELHE